MNNLMNHIEEEIVYSIVCSNCHTDVESWHSEIDIVFKAERRGFVVIEGKVYCERCAGER